jgi:hypothetical protein
VVGPKFDRFDRRSTLGKIRWGIFANSAGRFAEKRNFPPSPMALPLML